MPMVDINAYKSCKLQSHTTKSFQRHMTKYIQRHMTTPLRIYYII